MPENRGKWKHCSVAVYETKNTPGPFKNMPRNTIACYYIVIG